MTGEQCSWCGVEVRLDEGFRGAGGPKPAFDVMAACPVVVGDDVGACRAQHKPAIALYVGGMGARSRNFYNETVRRYGYEEAARHYASALTDPIFPPMGLRLRLKASFDTSRFPPQARVVLAALKRYGMMVADNGSNWFISGAPDPRWNNDDLHTLGSVQGSNFEVVDTSSLPNPG